MGAVTSVVRYAYIWVKESIVAPPSKQNLMRERTERLHKLIDECNDKAETCKAEMDHLELIISAKRKEAKLLQQRLRATHDVMTKHQAVNAMRQLKTAQTKWKRYADQHTQLMRSVSTFETGLMDLEASEHVMSVTGPLQKITIQNVEYDKIIDQNDENEERMIEIRDQSDELQNAMSHSNTRDTFSDEALLAELQEMADPGSTIHEREGELRIDTSDFTIDDNSLEPIVVKPVREPVRAAPQRQQLDLMLL